uniref:Coiled-coil domain containing 81 n=1 Tax=Sphenodon punctatus TaxID=8508 RepID=A0A8D0GZH3_SPHPU
GIWATVSEFVEKQLSMNKGVHIPGLGTFSFLRQKLEVGNNKFILIQRPVFLLSEKLAQIHGLKRNKIHTPGDIPIVQLNFIMLSLEGSYHREVVEGCIRETLLFFSRSIATKQNVEFTFKGIGVLIIRDNKVKMKFYKDFLQTMDGSGNLVKALSNVSLAFSPQTILVPLKGKKIWSLSVQCSGFFLFHTENLPAKRLLSRQAIAPAKVTGVRVGVNIPVYLHEERRRKELEDDRILVQFQILKDQEAIHKQQIKALVNREQNQKNSAFNLGVAEAMRDRKNEKSTDFHKSFIFVKRPPSPSVHIKQEEYAQSLSKQMKEKKEREIKLRQDKELIDRLEQVQLAEELAAQRATYLKDKMEEMQRYKAALDTQIKLKPLPLSVCEPYSEGLDFGKDDASNEKLSEKRQRAQEFYKYQLQAAAERKRTAILNQLVDQRKEEDMLQRAKKQWVADRGEQFERAFKMNLALAEDWRKSAGMKRQRSYEEKLFERAGDKLMLLDQCERYRRCFQCKRRTTNCGESNVWSDSKYIPGSRLMV